MDAVPDSRSPVEVYRARIAERSAEAAVCQRQHVWLGYARLALVVSGIMLAWLSFHSHVISRWWLLLPCLVFVLIARRHSAVLGRCETAQRAIASFERGIARAEDRWRELPSRGKQVDTSASLFAEDLDLFSAGGMFDLLCTARTSAAEDVLASWLLGSAERDVILLRQAAIAELRGCLALRESLASCEGPDVAKLDIASLAGWASASQALIPGWLRWLAPVLMLITVAAFAYYLATNAALALVLAVIVDAAITFPLQKRTQAIFTGAERASRSLRLAAAMIGILERESFGAALSGELQQRFRSKTGSASAALAKLSALSQRIEYRANYIVKILDAPLMYSVQLAGAVQAWRRMHGEALESWLRALADFEALVSLATYSFEHPQDTFAELVDGEPLFEAEQIGHPLIPAATCVRNDVMLGGDARLLLVSGSNMSGKSTLLRAVGLNTVLAMMGAPVRSAKLRLTPLHVGASIQVHDSLEQGRSRFYAEVLRLRDIVGMSESDGPVLFLLDELFGGTNSSDRLAGAEGIGRALLASGAIGMLSTHDLALTEIGHAGELALRNVHFEDRIENGKMLFDFRLRDGVVTHRNGLELMRLVGLKV